MTLAIVACALALPLLAVCFVALDLGRRFLTWAAAREQRLDADGQRAALAAVEKRVAHLEDVERQVKQAGGLLGRR